MVVLYYIAQALLNPQDFFTDLILKIAHNRRELRISATAHNIKAFNLVPIHMSLISPSNHIPRKLSNCPHHRVLYEVRLVNLQTLGIRPQTVRTAVIKLTTFWYALLITIDL